MSEQAAIGYDWSGYQGNTGFENVTSSDLGMPFLSIIQKGSAEFDVTHAKHKEKAIEGVLPGDIINTATRQILHSYNAAPLRVIPTFRVRIWQEWKSPQNGGGLVKTHNDASIMARTRQDENKKSIISEGEGVGNQIKETVSWFCLAEVEGDWVPVVVNMSGSNLGTARQWLTRATSIKWEDAQKRKFSPPIFSHVYHLKTGPRTKPGQSWFAFEIELEGVVKQKELAEKAISLSVDCTKMNQKFLAPIAQAASRAAQEAGDEEPLY